MMIPIRGIVLAMLFAGLVAGAPAMAGHHEPVLQVVSVNVKAGMLEKYQKQIKKLGGVLERIGSKATVRMWSNTQGGPDAGTIIVAVEYPNAEAWAADAPKIQSDEDWQESLAGLHKMRKLQGSSIWKDISPAASAASAGSVMLVTGVSVNPGKLDAYRERVGKGAAIIERLGLTSRLRMWQATLAGPNTGNVAVAVEYKDLATYVSEDAKLNADSEWQGILRGLSEIRTLGGRSLYREITP